VSAFPSAIAYARAGGRLVAGHDVVVTDLAFHRCSRCRRPVGAVQEVADDGIAGDRGRSSVGQEIPAPLAPEIVPVLPLVLPAMMFPDMFTTGLLQ